jgi:hypothetical protein
MDLGGPVVVASKGTYKYENGVLTSTTTEVGGFGDVGGLPEQGIVTWNGNDQFTYRGGGYVVTFRRVGVGLERGWRTADPDPRAELEKLAVRESMVLRDLDAKVEQARGGPERERLIDELKATTVAEARGGDR